MRPQNALFTMLLAWIGMLLLACSGSPDEVDPNLPGPGTEPNLTVEQRLQALKETATFVKTLGDLKSEVATGSRHLVANTPGI